MSEVSAESTGPSGGLGTDHTALSFTPARPLHTSPFLEIEIVCVARFDLVFYTPDMARLGLLRSQA